MDTTISMESLEKFEKNFDANRANAMAMNAVAANGVNASAITRPRERPPLIFPSAWSREKLPTRKRVAAAGCSQH